GGLLALLALGLNLVFGVNDVIWICYAESIMGSMYGIWWLHSVPGAPLWLAVVFGVAVADLLGAALHHFIVRPVLTAEPINPLLVTGGVLFFLQAAATVVLGLEVRNIGIQLPGGRVGELYLSMSRLLAFGV